MGPGSGYSRPIGQSSFPRAAQAEREVLHLPAYPELSDATIDRIADRVARAVTELGIARDRADSGSTPAGP